MQYLRNLHFKAKIIILIVPAILGLLLLGILRISLDIKDNTSANQINKLTLLSTFNNTLVHEMQKERGATAGFLGSKGEEFGDVLRAQRQLTDSAQLKRSLFLEKNKGSFQDKEIVAQLNVIKRDLMQLSHMRSQVDDLLIKTATAIKFYTDIHNKILNITPQIAKMATNSHIANQLVAYFNFLEAKENAGIERAVMSSVFGNNKFSNQSLNQFLTVKAKQDTYFDQFSLLVDKSIMASFEKMLSHSSVRYVNDKRTLAITKAETGGFSVDNQQWFEQSTIRINQLKTIENNIAQYLLKLTENMSNNAFNSLVKTILATAILLFIIIMLAILIGKMITIQVMSISQTINEVEKNNDLTLQIDISSLDELGDAAQNINKMLVTFKTAVGDIEQSSTLLAASSEETSTTTEQNMQNLQRQQDETQLVATAIEQMSNSVQEVASNTAKTAELVIEVDNSVDGSVVEITHTRNEMDKLSDEMTLANELILALQNSSTNINSVVEVIKSVAEQTNLLALNAAIEAARAGEQGRGFAVVADEVRTLAQRTQESTSEIESIVSQFQQDAMSVSNCIGKCSSEVELAVNQISQLANNLNNIKEAATSITDMSTQIASATEEQVAVASEMASNINTISELSTENASSGNQIAAAGREQTGLANELAELSNRFKC
ncbi:methyl-accepting chemotaxis protein [Pseudoalteromonas denitrificans]|uniref:Methyl-accepting chemotaxis protein n=1 Tax=Pseudoalteromonas denitrificans DSM 6059 TaxID=1123010 RepID=A0A1I1PUU5_9GAMM|nr:methyl-accepting chemotaxis protein [Pseudoalteromonas denitrificans]SFD13629.1 Methyl-accepting chemotaxis protein [Pseudoalteromonas denitrificans DSM 6059]